MSYGGPEQVVARHYPVLIGLPTGSGRAGHRVRGMAAGAMMMKGQCSRLMGQFRFRGMIAVICRDKGEGLRVHESIRYRIL